MKNQSINFQRAQNMLLQDKFNFHRQQFAKDLANFLSDYFTYDGLALDVVEGKTCDLVICVNVSNVKKTRVV